MCKNMERVQFSAILHSTENNNNSVSIYFDITDNISFGACNDSIVFTTSDRELTDKYANFVLKHYRVFGGNPTLALTRDEDLEEFGIYQITITVK